MHLALFSGLVGLLVSERRHELLLMLLTLRPLRVLLK